MLSRVIAVADAYNAMTSHRPYREAMPSRVARLRLAQAARNELGIRAIKFVQFLTFPNDRIVLFWI